MTTDATRHIHALLFRVRRLSARLLVFCCLSACSARAPAEAHESITNGTVDPGDPAVVAIVTSDGITAHCTGTLVLPHTILTAAHCLDSANLMAWRVFFGPVV